MPQIEITLNGKPFTLSADRTVAELARSLGLSGGGRGVAVALDGEVVPHGAWASTRLEPGQRVEAVIATQGG